MCKNLYKKITRIQNSKTHAQCSVQCPGGELLPVSEWDLALDPECGNGSPDPGKLPQATGPHTGHHHPIPFNWHSQQLTFNIFAGL